MQTIHSIKKLVLLLLPFICRYASADSHCAEGFGIVGGSTNNLLPAAYLVQPNGSYSNQLLPSSLGAGSVNSVAMNGAGIGFVGGDAGSKGFAYYVYPNGSLSSQLLSSITGLTTINSVSLNDPGTALVGGTTSGNASAYLISPNLSVSSDLIAASGGTINGVSINGQGEGLIGGYDSSGGIAYYVLNGAANALAVPNTGQILTTAINASGTGILGGFNGSNDAVAYFAYAPNTLSAELLPVVANTSVSSVDINSSGVALAAVNSTTGAPVVYLIEPDLTVSTLPLPTLPTGNINDVAINDSQMGILGGTSGTSPVLFLSYPNGNLSPQLLPAQMGGPINTVAINTFGTGLAVADNGTNSVAYLVSSSGSITTIYPSLSGTFDTAAMIQSLSQIITVCLGGNNLDVAKYINKYAPEKAYYFLPALVDGTLAKALESVAPTRNAASVFTADNNLFLLNESLSRHLRDQRHVHRYNWGVQKDNTAAENLESDGLFASLNWPSGSPDGDEVEERSSSFHNSRPYSLWTEMIGAVSFQKKEHQTPGFDPWTGGVVLGIEAQLGYSSQIGGGAAYTYTHLHQHEGGGYSDINQEYLFLYGLIGTRYAYADIALWGGLFQTHQVRKIHMEGFHFKSTSNPTGWQVSPHLEVGGDIYPYSWLTIEPFIMGDWANNWQDSYKEKGEGPFNMGQKHHYSSFLRSELGIRFYEEVRYPSWRVTFLEKASYVNKKPFEVGTVHAFLVGSPGAFTVETLSTTQNLGVGEFAILFEPLDLSYPYGAITYQGEFSESYQSHQLLLELCWCF